MGVILRYILKLKINECMRVCKLGGLKANGGFENDTVFK